MSSDSFSESGNDQFERNEIVDEVQYTDKF